ncbi:MAG: UDP-N-acetylglucosamine 2-epimerase (hydrolyzing) [Candidatus Omnitrophota bacterium]|nr:MAG: UDP-N-acetylglucosamine 2-epimerase (hydrolyzing) [Candidatus Omnitrophota bacterium]
MKRKICVFTGARAEYGLLKPLMDEIKKDKQTGLQILVSGMHLLPEFGMTYKAIEKDGFVIDEKIKILLDSDTPVGISKSIGSGLMEFSKAYERLKPDIVVILGDRFEAFAAAASAIVSGIPIAHIHGGEATFGVVDEAFRHSITKMSHLHFTSTQEHRKKVIQLGEDPKSVFNVGAIGLDNIKGLRLLSKNSLEEELDFKFARKNLLVTFHPVTLEKNTSKKQFQNLLDELDALEDTHIIFTKANADTYGRVINRMIDDYVPQRPYKAIAFTSMGQLKYLSAMQFVDAVVGNSSSGIIEMPSFKKATIDIGDRQKGRVKAKTVIECRPTREDIRRAFKKLYSEGFKRTLKDAVNPYEPGKPTASKIKTILKNHNLNNILKKTFYNIRVDKKDL